VSHDSSTVHLRGASRAAVVEAIDARMRRRGFERILAPSPREPVVVRVRVLEQGAWVSVTFAKAQTAHDEAPVLSATVHGIALLADYWEDESVTTLILYDRGSKLGEVSLPRDARPVSRGKVAVPLGPLSRLVGDGAREDGLEIRIALAHGEDDDGSTAYISAATAARAFHRAFGIDELHVDPDDEDDDDELRTLAYRPRPGSAAGKRLRAQEDARRAALRAAHDARVYLAGWLAFDVTPARIAGVLQAIPARSPTRSPPTSGSSRSR